MEIMLVVVDQDLKKTKILKRELPCLLRENQMVRKYLDVGLVMSLAITLLNFLRE